MTVVDQLPDQIDGPKRHYDDVGHATEAFRILNQAKLLLYYNGCGKYDLCLWCFREMGLPIGNHS